MAVHSFKAVQQIPVSLDKAWSFFSSPARLASITPVHFKFTILSPLHSDSVYAGQILEYRVSPVWSIPLYWMTEITQVEDQKYFVDEQRYGPYSLWHHQHHFKDIEGGVEMTDIVHYKIPLGWLGDIANALLVRRQLKELFDYRFQKIEELLGKWSNQ